MKISPINVYYNNNHNKQFDKNRKTLNNTTNVSNKNISFGWCWPHIRAMESLNDKFKVKLNNIINQENQIKSSIQSLNKLKQTKYSILDESSAKATELFAKYCNIQYTMSEMLPSYALKQNQELQKLISEYETLNNPVNLLISINNITKLNMEAGIDKNTMKKYTPEQTRKAKAGTQLYTTILLMEQLEKNINSEKDPLCRELFTILKRDIDSIYGENTYERVISLSRTGKSITLEQKRASLNLIKEFDEKSKPLTLSKDFTEKLNQYIENKNIEENRTIENTGIGMKDAFVLKIAYHTHPHNQSNELNEHHHHHHKEFASEEEHILYHKKQKAEQEKNK